MHTLFQKKAYLWCRHLQRIKVFSPQGRLEAKVSRELYEMIRCPLYHDFVGISKNNLLLNIQVSIDDIKRSEAIFGNDL
jgi:hypothetical protein